MAAVLSQHSEPPSQGTSDQSSNPLSPTSAPRSSNSNLHPKLETSSPSPSAPSSARSSHARNRLSTYSQSRSRPTSAVFPLFHSSLTYALVRDFAYPAFHPLHYGPPPESPSSGHSSPTSPYPSDYSSSRRLSDPPPNWEGSSRGWSAGPWGGDGGALYADDTGDQLPSTSFSSPDSDDDGSGDISGKLTKNHRKSKSLYTDELRRGRRKSKGRNARSKPHNPKQPGLNAAGLFTSGGAAGDDGLPGTSYISASPSAASPGLHPPFSDSSPHASELEVPQDHRPTSTSLDESFAGPSLALYTFVPENANELALREGQIIQVGYRHGQGWLVAMDLETGEQGLVPEEYVRLLEDIEGWEEEDTQEVEGVGREEREMKRDGGDREVKMGQLEEGLGKVKEPGGEETMLPERNKT